MIKAICLDLDGLVFTKESFQHFKENLAPSVPQAKRDTVLALSPEMKAYKKGIINDTTYRERARNQLKISFTNEEIAQLLAENYTLDVEVEALAKALRKQGYKLCICSNNFPMRINALDQKFNFLSLFDVAIFSYEVGVLKPER
jgi:FMN phosphatase YigB (HAD superfamily)